MDRLSVWSSGPVQREVDGSVEVGDPYGYRIILLGGQEGCNDQVADQDAGRNALPGGFGFQLLGQLGWEANRVHDRRGPGFAVDGGP